MVTVRAVSSSGGSPTSTVSTGVVVRQGLRPLLTEATTPFPVDHVHDEHFGARPLKRAIQRYIEDPLSEKILTAEFSKGDEIEVDVSTTEKDKLEFRVLSPSPQA